MRNAVELRKEVERLLLAAGAAQVGVADLRNVPGAVMPTGICALVALPPEIVKPLVNHPTHAYYNSYHRINAQMQKMMEEIAAFLRERDYRAIANTEENLPIDEADCSPLPHKTVACRAGLGWIGKNNLLTTESFGNAVRLCVVVTDAPLPTDEAVTDSRCGTCSRCVEECPAQALYGTLWRAGIPREEMVDRSLCERIQKERSIKFINVPIAICGRCFAVCPYTQRYIAREIGK